mmetsp:Transcript_10279/g.33981  ORF Transcript_10279/g.33981 Transcript_10279/m.33981 type:complete len:206 (+) Transcript_10279:330-947(+)|eukprot:scaffold1112_cov116-Isochrysis_galbana.AAC.25
MAPAHTYLPRFGVQPPTPPSGLSQLGRGGGRSASRAPAVEDDREPLGRHLGRQARVLVCVKHAAQLGQIPVKDRLDLVVCRVGRRRANGHGVAPAHMHAGRQGDEPRQAEPASDRHQRHAQPLEGEGGEGLTRMAKGMVRLVLPENVDWEQVDAVADGQADEAEVAREECNLAPVIRQQLLRDPAWLDADVVPCSRDGFERPTVD